MGVGKSTFAFKNTAITLDGGSTTINITRDNQSYSHKLSHGYGDIATLAVGTTSYTWKPTASQLTKFFEEIPNQKTRQIDIYLDTYNGSTLVGRDVHALTVTLSEATGKPTILTSNITDNNATTKSWGVIVNGKSSCEYAVLASSKYGASVPVNGVCIYGGNKYTSIGDLIGSLPLTTTPTNYVIGLEVTDSRGITTSANITKSIAQYEAPTINRFEVFRCDASGNEVEDGTKAKALVKGSWAFIGGKNPATFKIGYRLNGTEQYTYQSISVTDGIVDYEQILNITLDQDSDYDFAIELADTFAKHTEEDKADMNNIIYVSPTGGVTIRAEEDLTMIAIDDIRLNGNGIHLTAGHFGAIFEAKYDPETDTGISMLFKGPGTDDSKIHFTGAQVTMDIPVLNSGNCNNLTDTGKYYLGNNSTNRPVTKNGWLECMKYSTDYCHQTYTTYTGERYTRMMQAGTWGAWIQLANYVVAEGTSGGWNYRKWSNGIGEAWGRFTKKSTVMWGLYITEFVQTFPFTFKAVPHVVASYGSSGDAQSYATLVDANTTNAIVYGRAQSSGNDCWCHIHAIGQYQ